MRPPAVAVIGNLVRSRAGRVWAIWCAPATPYVWLADRQEHAEHSRVRALLASLPVPGDFATCMVLHRPDLVPPRELLTDGRWRETAVRTVSVFLAPAQHHA